MNTRRLFLTGTTACLLLFSIATYASWWPFSQNKGEADKTSELTQITFEDLIPDDFVPPVNPFTTMTQDEIDKLLDGSDESNAELDRLQKEFHYAPVVEALDGKRVKLAAYVTPLEFDGQTKMSEFLLVPYVGACMHTPPPPANQVVHAESQEAIELPNIYDAVWAIGTISTDSVKSSLAESGYRLKIEKVVPYSAP